MDVHRGLVDALALAAGRLLLDDASLLGPLVEAANHGPLAARVGRSLGAGRHAVQAQRELRRRSSGGLGVEGDGLPVDVGEVVAQLVVAGILGCAGAGEDAGRRDAELEEGDVVRRGSEAAVLSSASWLGVVDSVGTYP